MKNAVLAVAAMAIVAALGAPLYAQADGEARLVAPPAIHLPYGARVMTEINISDSDVLGIIKQAIPAAVDAARQIVQQQAAAQASLGEGAVVQPTEAAMWATMVAGLDVTELSEAIAGVEKVRMLAARYDREMSHQDFIDQFSSGVAKTGSYTKIFSDVGHGPFSMAVFAEANQKGYVGVLFQGSEVYAARIVGFLDIPKIMTWGAKLAPLFMGVRHQMTIEQPAVDPDTPVDPDIGIDAESD